MLVHVHMQVMLPLAHNSHGYVNQHVNMRLMYIHVYNSHGYTLIISRTRSIVYGR